MNGVYATSDTVARLDHCHRQARCSEIARGGEAGGAGANYQN